MIMIKKLVLKFFIILFSIFFNSCEFRQMNNLKLYYNGKIYSYNPNDNSYKFFNSMVVNGNKIEYLGDLNDVKKIYKFFCEEIDLKNRLVLPGFIDSHTHMFWGGMSLIRLNLCDCKSKEEFIEKIKVYAQENKDIKWILGGNWDHEDFEKPELPRKEWIDSVINDRPVFLTRLDLHMGVANSKALELAKINKNTPNPEGGEIQKDENGELTGILKDKAIDLINEAIPSPDDKEYEEILSKTIKYANQQGITAVFDVTQEEEIKTIRNFDRERKLTLRFFSRLPIEKYYYKKISDVKKLYDGERFKVLALKAFADGSLGSSTAYFFESYEDKKNYYGLPMEILKNGKLLEMTKAGMFNGWKISIHAIGDKANHEVLNIFQILSREESYKTKRHLIEHCQHLIEKDIKRFAELNIIASVQPYHLYDDGAWAEKKIGKKRARYSYAFKSLINAKACVAAGSDWPVVDINPLLGIYAAVTRRTASSEKSWTPEEIVSVEDAVKMYTYWAAYAIEMENYIGVLAPGMLADFIVVSQNIFTCLPEEIKNTKILLTVLDGDVIFRDENF